MNVSGKGSSRSSSRRAEPETISDAEDEDDGDIPAELVDPDAEDVDQDATTEEDARDGLQGKYSRALRDDATGAADSAAAENSFKRYLNASSMNG